MAVHSATAHAQDSANMLLVEKIAVVRGNDGETLGIVSVEDILEELVGEIYDEDDKPAESEHISLVGAGVQL